MENATASTKAQLSQQDEKIAELITRNGELQNELLGVHKQNEALSGRMERLIGLVKVLAKRCNTHFNALLKYQHMLVCVAIPTPQVSLSLTSPLMHFDTTVQARMNPPEPLPKEPPPSLQS